MANIYRRPKGLPIRMTVGNDALHGVVARHVDVVSAVNREAIAARNMAERFLDASPNRTGHSHVVRERGDVDQYITIIDSDGRPSAVAQTTGVLHRVIMAHGHPSYGVMKVKANRRKNKINGKKRKNRRR